MEDPPEYTPQVDFFTLNYEYYPDGKVKAYTGETAWTFRYASTTAGSTYRYDSANRYIGHANLGVGTTTYNLDPFGHTTQVTINLSHNPNHPLSSLWTYTNNRRTGNLYNLYDDDGRLLEDDSAYVQRDGVFNATRNERTYNAAGQLNSILYASALQSSPPSYTYSYDGDGRQVKAITPGSNSVYKFYSSVTGKELARVGSTGIGPSHNSIYVAEGIEASSNATKYHSPIAGTVFTLAHVTWPWNPEQGNSGMYVAARDVFGNQVNMEYVPPEPLYPEPIPDPTWGAWWQGDPRDMDSGCVMDGHVVPCDYVLNAINMGWGEQCPYNNCGPQTYNMNGSNVLSSPFTLNADGTSGYNVPIWANNQVVAPNGQSTNYPAEIVGWRFQSIVNDWRSPFHFFSSDEKLSDEDCDNKLSRIFGGNAKAMEGAGDIGGHSRSGTGHSAQARNDLSATVKMLVYDERTDKDKWVTRRRSERGGIIHTYTNSQGSKRTDIPLTTPGGWTGVTPYFTGGNSGLVFNYSNGMTLEFVHVGTTNKDNVPSIPTNPGVGNLATIGTIAGAGGTSPTNYNHSHIVYFLNKATNERIDPRVLFCGF